MIKLIATDMDGTFLDSSKRFSMEFFDIFAELRKKGIKFVIASGNQYFRLYQKFLPISNEMYFIGENGSYIAKGAKLISTNTLKKEQVQAVIQLVEKHPELNIINVYNLKFKDKLTIPQVASELNMSEDNVIEALNELVDIVQ